MKKKKWLKYIGALLLGVLFVMQFFPIDKTNPPFEEADDFISIESPPTAIATMIKDACYDCHSNRTKYPWYTSIAPLSWWIQGHIDHGRGEMNFSEWGQYDDGKRKHKLEECSEKTEATEMPLLSYIIAHPEARLSTEERADLVAWFKIEEQAY